MQHHQQQQTIDTDKETAKLMEQLMSLSLSEDKTNFQAGQTEYGTQTTEKEIEGEQKREKMWELCYKILTAGDRLTQKCLFRNILTI